MLVASLYALASQEARVRFSTYLAVLGEVSILLTAYGAMMSHAASTAGSEVQNWVEAMVESHHLDS
jgi:hypothetical protein